MGFSGESEKLKIRLSALDTKHTNLIRKNDQIAKQLATREQEICDLKKTLEEEERAKGKIQDEYYK